MATGRPVRTAINAGSTMTPSTVLAPAAAPSPPPSAPPPAPPPRPPVEVRMRPVQPAPAPPPAGRPAPGEPQLHRRVPQANLAPELRRDNAGYTAAEEHARPAAPGPDAVQARDALSRYQASRRAARALVEGSFVDDRDRPGSGGGDWA
jgi:hypothetical protein